MVGRYARLENGQDRVVRHLENNQDKVDLVIHQDTVVYSVIR
jgi:hypothetical protein